MGFLKNTMLLWISGDVFVLEMLLPLIQDGVFFNQWLDLWLSKPVKTLQSFSVCLSLIRKKKGCCFVSVKRAYFIGLCYFFFYRDTNWCLIAKVSLKFGGELCGQQETLCDHSHPEAPVAVSRVSLNAEPTSTLR